MTVRLSMHDVSPCSCTWTLLRGARGPNSSPRLSTSRARVSQDEARSMRVLTVIGARPEFIKSVALSRALLAAGDDELIVHTGQHYDTGLSAIFFDELGLPVPWRNLHAGSGTHAEQTASMLVGL